MAEPVMTEAPPLMSVAPPADVPAPAGPLPLMSVDVPAYPVQTFVERGPPAPRPVLPGMPTTNAAAGLGGRPGGGIDPSKVITGRGRGGSGPPTVENAAPRVDTGGYGYAAGAEREMRNAMIAAELSRRPGYSPPTPEREQRTGYGLSASRGPDPALVAEQDALRLGRELSVPDRPPPAVVNADDVLALFAAPKGEDPKAWATREAQRIRDEGGSVAGEVAKGLDGTGSLALRALAPDKVPAALRNRSGEEIDAWERDNIAGKEKRRDQYINALDAAQNAERKLHADALGGDRAAQEEYVRRYGEGGLVGSERRKMEISQTLAEEKAKAEELYGKTEAEYAERNKAIEAESKRRLGAITAQIDALNERASRGIDTGRFWKSRTTGQEIGLAFAVFAGAIGAGLTGQKNAALEQIDKAIERDIEEQRRQIHEGTTQKLTVLQQVYKNVLGETGDERAASLAMRNSALEEGKRRLAAFAERAGKAEVRESAAAALAAMKDKQLAAQLEMSERVRGSTNTNFRVIPASAGGWGGGPDYKRVMSMLKENRELAKEGVGVDVQVTEAGAKSAKAAKDSLPLGFSYGGQTYEPGFSVSESELEHLRAKFGALSAAQREMDIIRAEANNYGSRMWSPSRFNAAVGRLGDMKSILSGQGVVTNPEQVRLIEDLSSFRGNDKTIKDLDSFFSGVAEQSLRNVAAKEIAPPKR